MDDTQHELLRSLGTIGEVQENDRLDAKGTKLEIQKPSLYNSFMRTFVYRQTKDDTISRVKSVVHEAFGEVDRYVKTSKPTRKQLDFLSLLLDEMQGSVRGLQNLQKTYAGVSASQDMKLYAKDMQKKCNMLREYLIRFGVIDDDDSSSGVAPVERSVEKPVERTVGRAVERAVERTVEKPVERTVERTVERAAQPIDYAVERAAQPIDYAVERAAESKTESSTVPMPMVSNGKKNADHGLNSWQSGRSGQEVQGVQSGQGVRPPPLDLSRVAAMVDCSPAVYGTYGQARVPPYTYGMSTTPLSFDQDPHVYAMPAMPAMSAMPAMHAMPAMPATPATPEVSPATDDDEDDEDISCGATISSDDSSFF